MEFDIAGPRDSMKCGYDQEKKMKCGYVRLIQLISRFLDWIPSHQIKKHELWLPTKR